MASDGTIKISTELDSKAAESAMSRFSGIAKAGVKGVSIAVGAVSAALSAAGGYAIKTGIDFESAFAGVTKTVDATDSELAEFRQGIRDMAKDMPQSASQIAEVAEAAGQLGIQNENILSFTEVMSNLGVATNMSAIEAATALARLANITQMPQENFDRLGSTIVALGNNLATTESEITEMGLRLAGAGKQVGMSEDQILGLAGALSSVGIEADAGGSSVSTVMAKIQLAVEQGGESLEQFADVAGMSSSEFKQAFEEDAAHALVSFVDGLGTMEERGKSAIGTLDDMEITEIRQRDALLRLAGAGDVLAESLDIASEAWKENTALTKEAEQRYETMESRLQILKNNVADLGITFYDSIRDPLKSTVDEGIVYVDKLSAAFGEGGLKSAVSAAGGIFADLAADVASHAPDMVNSAVQFINAFASGLYENRGQIMSAAGDIAVALGEGLAVLLPSSVSGPVRSAVKEIGDSFKDGGLRSAVSTVSTAFKNFSSAAGNLAKTTLPPLTKTLDLVSGNLDLVASSAAAAFAAFKGHKQITSATSALNKGIKAWKAAEKAVDAYHAAQLLAMESGTACTATLTVGQAVVGLFTSKVDMATKAQTLWNAVMTAFGGPVGLAITAIGALAAGLGAYILTTDRASVSQGGLTEKQKESIEASRESIRNIQEEAAARQKNIDASTAEMENAEMLWGELQKCVDANGQVKAGYEARAEYITGALSSALGMEISLTDGIIDNYGELEGSIYDVIAAKKAEAMLNAMQADYDEARKNERKATKDFAAALDEVNSKKEKLAELKAELAAEEESAIERYAETGQIVKEYSGKYRELQEEIAKVNGELETNQATLDEASEALKNNQDAMSDYETMLEAAMTKNTETINNAMVTIQSGIDTTLEAGSEAALQQAQEFGATLMTMLEAQAAGMEEATQETVDGAAESMALSINEISASSENMKALLESVGTDGAVKMLMAFQNADLSGNLSTEAQSGMQAMIAVMAGMEGELSQESKNALDSFISGFDSLEEESKTVWSQAWYGALEGLEGFETLKDPATEGADAFLESLKEALMVQSPSRAVKEIFSYVWPGAQEGLQEGQEELSATGTSVIQSFLNTLSESSIFEGARQIGYNIMSFFGIGVGSQIENSRMQGKANADSANSGAGSVDPTPTGSKFGGLLGGGIGSTVGALFTQGKSIADSAKSGAGSVDPTPTGNKFTSDYANAIASKAVESIRAGHKIATDAEGSSGLRSVDTSGAGYDFGAGFGGGVTSAIQAAVSAAYNLASRALSTIKSTLGIKSPSRETRKVGGFFGEGFELGIKDEEASVRKATEALSETALQSLDTDALMERIKSIDVAGVMDQIDSALSDVNLRISDRITSKLEIADRAEAQKLECSLSQSDIERLAKATGKMVGAVISEKFKDIGVYMDSKQVGRLVTPAVNDELGKLERRKT